MLVLLLLTPGCSRSDRTTPSSRETGVHRPVARPARLAPIAPVVPAHPTFATAGAKRCLLSEPVEVSTVPRGITNIRLAVGGQRAVLAWGNDNKKKQVTLLWLNLKGRAVGKPFSVPGSRRFEIFLGRKDLFIRSTPYGKPVRYSLLDAGARKVRATIQIPAVGNSTWPKVQLVGRSLHITRTPGPPGWLEWLVFDRNCGLRRMPWRKGKGDKYGRIGKLVPAARKAVLLYLGDKGHHRMATWDPATDKVVDRLLVLPGLKVLSRRKKIMDINSVGPSTILGVEGLAPQKAEWRYGALQILLSKKQRSVEFPPGKKAPGKWLGTPLKLAGKVFWGTFGLDGRPKGALRSVKSKAWSRSPWAGQLECEHNIWNDFDLVRVAPYSTRQLPKVRMVTGGKRDHNRRGYAAHAWTGKSFLVGWATWDKDMSLLSRRMLTRVVDCRPRKPPPRVVP